MPTIDKVHIYKQNSQSITFEDFIIMSTNYHPPNLEEPFAVPNPNSTMQNNLNDDSEEVSLCDLPLYGYDTTYSNTLYSEDSMKGDESFEFFSEEWLKNNKDRIFFPNKDIVFCGNLIIPKIPTSRNSNTNTHEFKKRDHIHGSTKLDLNSGSCRNSEFAKLSPVRKGRTHGGAREPKRVFPASVSLKSRWYYYGFGLAGIPTEMELSAIRSRQNRHRRSNSAGTLGGSGKEESGGFWQEKGLRRLIRDLSCDGRSRPSSMVKGSLVCIPRV